MKKICRALCALFITACVLRAADKDDQESPLGDFMPTFDDLIEYVPKVTVRLGFRGIVGAKTSFGGQGMLMSVIPSADITTSNIDREYHDGHVGVDTRAVTTPGDFNGVPATDGKTNNWSFVSESQAQSGGTITLADGTQVPNDGLMAMHAYSMTNTDTAMGRKKSGASFGVELSGERDFGALFGTKLHWGVIGGMSVNQIFVSRQFDLAGTLTTTTDYYDLFGETVTGAAAGDVDTTTILIGNHPLARTVGTSDATVSNVLRLRGAYVTFRAGPTLHIPVTEKFSANVSAGAIFLYVGTDYQVTQEFLPETGDGLTSAVRDGASDVLPGYYADADVQYSLTDNTGLYAGAVIQSAGTYTQKISSTDGQSNYNAKIDFGSMQALRAGFLFRF
ncbi:MAG TPA: hypothetical protein VHE13_04455 [Opitutus sp.]|nr:hypothetical protein [Opitutus sp.]